jgi:hypothetical protein
MLLPHKRARKNALKLAPNRAEDPSVLTDSR